MNEPDTTAPQPEPDFRELYRRCVRSHVLPKGVDAVRDCLKSAAIDSTWDAQSHTIQRFKNIQGYRVSIGVKTGFFPTSIEQFEGPQGLTRMREAFLKLDLALPPYYAMGFLSPMAAQAETLQSVEEREEFTRTLFAQMYNEATVATLCTGVYKTTPSIAPYHPHITESAKAYYAGLYRAAILTLIPCIEGIIRNTGDAFVETIAAVQKRYIKEIVYRGYDWVPSEIAEVRVFDRFDEAIQMMESVKFFIRASLYQHTSRYSSAIGLNRHGIVHALIANFHSPSNYWRLITLINGLAITSIFAGHAASLFFPAETRESVELARYLSRLRDVTLTLGNSEGQT
jgi:hypothetical protein